MCVNNLEVNKIRIHPIEQNDILYIHIYVTFHIIVRCEYTTGS
jgi:hypothetical protein